MKNIKHGKVTKLILLSILFLTFSLSSASLPPVFGSEYNGKTQKDELSRLYISPKTVLWKSDNQLIKNEHLLLSAGNSQAAFIKENICSLKNTDTDTCSILLDYGIEIHGGLQLVMGSSSRREPSLVRIRFGESVGECNSDTHNRGGRHGFSTDDHAKRDITIEIPRDGMIEIGNTGFRFVRIDLLQPNTTVRIKETRAILRYRDIPYLGSFRSSDERLNKIWLTGAYTVHLNMQEYLWDGIKRDRVIWLGDMHPEVASILSVFGDNEIVPQTLDLAVQIYPLPGWMNGMSAYSLWYLIIHHDWYMHSGDINFLQKHKQYITGLIDLILQNTDAEGNESMGKKFLDWPSSPNKKGVEAGYRALMVWAMDNAAFLCGELNEPLAKQKAAECANRIRKKTKSHNNLKQAAALMAISGIKDNDTSCIDIVCKDGSDNFSTFYGYYMLEAMAINNRRKESIDIIREYWGAMIDMGATTFWEDFDLKWTENAVRIDEFDKEGYKNIHGSFGAYCYPGYRHSLCHGWASGPTAWLTEYVLGVKIIKPGCKVIKITPFLGDLDYAEGTFPTPHGLIYIKHTKRSNGRIISDIKAPKGVKIIK